jgi:hypothetical protein
VYNEDVFQYFLEIERSRSRVSGQSFLLLVISSVDPGEVLATPMADSVLAALAKSVRDTDFVGWYAQGKAIGAVLIQAVDPSKVDTASRVSTRLSSALARQLPTGLVDRLRFRLCQIRAEREVWI